MNKCTDCGCDVEPTKTICGVCWELLVQDVESKLTMLGEIYGIPFEQPEWRKKELGL